MNLLDIVSRDCFHVVSEKVVENVFAMRLEFRLTTLQDEVIKLRIVHAALYEHFYELRVSKFIDDALQAIFVDDRVFINIHPPQEQSPVFERDVELIHCLGEVKFKVC